MLSLALHPAYVLDDFKYDVKQRSKIYESILSCGANLPTGFAGAFVNVKTTCHLTMCPKSLS